MLYYARFMALGEIPQPQEARRQEIISGSPTMQAILARDVTQRFLNDRHADLLQAILERYQPKNFVRRIIGSTNQREQARGTIATMTQGIIDAFTTFGFIDVERNATDPEADRLLKGVSETLLFAGSEIDDANDARLVEDDIAQYLIFQDKNSGGRFFSDEARKMLAEEGGQILLHNTIYQILLSGVNMRAFQTHLPLKGDSQQPGDDGSKKRANEDTNDPIKDFINTLPGLDNL